MTEPIKFSIPLVPPSVNHYIKHTRSGRHFQVSEAVAFKQEVAIAARGLSVRAKRFMVTIVIVLGKGDRGDIDNFPKLTLDGMAACGVFQNMKGERSSDAHVRHLRVILNSDARPAVGYTEVEVEGMA